MRSYGIQDDSSEHEHQKAHSSSRGEDYDMKYVIDRVIKRARSTRKRKRPSIARNGEPLSHSSLSALVAVWNRLDNEVEGYEKCIFTAGNSPSRTLQLFTGKSFLGFIKFRVEAYLISDKEHDTDGLLVSLEELLARASKQRRIVGYSESASSVMSLIRAS